MTVYYPFHPLHRQQLEVVSKTRRGDGAVIVLDPSGMRLKIPVWMLEPDAGRFEICLRPEIGGRTLLALVDLLDGSVESRSPDMTRPAGS